MVTTKYYDMETFIAAEYEPTNRGFVASQLMRLHREALAMQSPVIFECGVNQGYSTGFLAWACEKNGGILISVDINDCSDAVESSVWTFIQSDDAQQDVIFQRAPQLKLGIDFMYIDSLHSPKHVEKLLMLYYPYIKQGGIIAVDDVDPLPYLNGKRKDNIRQEIIWRAMGEVVRRFFYANEGDVVLEMYYGSTGLAILRKFSPLGTEAKPPSSVRLRRFSLRESLKMWLGYS